MGDVTQMFHQVRVLPSDRDALRFLRHFNENFPVDTYHMNVHLFGKTNSTSCSNWALRRTALDKCENFNVHVINEVLYKSYMDNYLNSFDNLDKLTSDRFFKIMRLFDINLAKLKRPNVY